MKLIIRLILNTVAVLVTAELLTGVHVNGFISALVAAVVIALLNAFVKPIFVVLTIPITVFTLGLFMLVINAIIILMADYLLAGFDVQNFWWALLFAIILAIISSFFNSIVKTDS